MYVGVELTPEQAVLGCIIASGELIHEVSLQPHHFIAEKHRILFENMKELVEEGSAIDIPLLTQKLASKKLVESVDGVSYIYNLSSSVATFVHIHHYEKLIFQNYREHAARELSMRLMERPTDENIQKAITYFTNLLEFEKGDEVDNESILIELASDMAKSREELGNISSGIESLDDITGGWNKGELTIIAGRPSMGKTAFSLTIATKACQQKQTMVSIFSLEMTAKEILKRLVNAAGKMNGNKWKNPKERFNESDYRTFSATANSINKLDMKINDTANLTTMEINSIMRKRVRKYPNHNHIVIIDYLQIISVPGNFERHDLRIGSITKHLKQMAVDLHMPVICLSQLSRGVEQRADKRPMLSDLRDSGSIEQDADNVFFLYRDEYYNREEPSNLVEVSILKQRNGATGMFKMNFEKEYGRFVEVGK